LAWPVVILAALLAGGAGYFAEQRLALDVGIDKMLSPELAFRQNEIAVGDAFPQTRNTLTIVVESENAETADEAAASLAARLAAIPAHFRAVHYPDGDPFFRRNGLLYLNTAKLEEMSSRLVRAQPLLSSLAADPTLRGLTDILRRAVDEADERAAAAIGPALNRMAATVRSLEEGRDARLSWQSLLEDGSPDDETTTRKIVLAQPAPSLDKLAPAAAAVDAIYDSAASLGLDEAAGVDVRVTGEAVMQQEELQALQSGLGLTGLLSLGLVILLLVFGLQSLRLVGAALFTLAVGLSWTAAFAAAVYGAVGTVSIAFVVLVAALSINFSIHFALRYREALAANAHHDALKQAGAEAGMPLALSAAAAAIGFLSFLPTDYRGIAELGAISAFGVAVTLFLNLTLLPALLAIMPMRVARATRWTAASRRTWYQTLVRRYALSIAVLAGVLGIVAATIAPYAWFDDDPLNLRDPTAPAVQTQLELLDDVRAKPYAAEAIAPSASAAAQLAQQFKKLPQVQDAVTVNDLIPPSQDEKRAVVGEMAQSLSPFLSMPRSLTALSDMERSAVFDELRALLTRAQGGLAANARTLATVLDRMPRSPESLSELQRALLGGFPPFREHLAALLAPQKVTLELLPESLRSRSLSADGRALVTIHPRHDLRDPAARQEFVDAIRSVSADVTGPPVRFAEIGNIVVTAFNQAMVTACLLIVLLLFAVLRRPLDVALTLAPLALAMLLTIAFTVLLKIPLNLINIVVLPLTLGLGVAFAIQIVMRQRSDGNGGFMETSTPRAVAFSALATIGAFGTFTLSDHPGLASMGVLLTLAIGLTMACTLLLLPALLELASRRR
jgi:hopanoid biosynthesis associated RND transporter like protein HpnN